MTQSEFKAQLADFLAVDVSEVTDEALLADLGWDSLSLLSVIGLVEEEWGIEASEAELNACVSVSDMLNIFHGRWAA